jgi:hypothetical protein
MDTSPTGIATVSKCCHGKKVFKSTNYIIQAGNVPETMQRLWEYDQKSLLPWTTLRDLSQDPS